MKLVVVTGYLPPDMQKDFILTPNLFPMEMLEWTNNILLEFEHKKSVLKLWVHSPYALSTINNAIVRYDALLKMPNKFSEFQNKPIINFNNVLAYYFEKGEKDGINILNTEYRLIDAQQLDEAS